MGILQARILERVGCHGLLQGNLPDPGVESASPALAAVSLPLSHLGYCSIGAPDPLGKTTEEGPLLIKAVMRCLRLFAEYSKPSPTHIPQVEVVNRPHPRLPCTLVSKVLQWEVGLALKTMVVSSNRPHL